MIVQILINGKWYPASDCDIEKGDWYRTEEKGSKAQIAKQDGKINEN